MTDSHNLGRVRNEGTMQPYDPRLTIAPDGAVRRSSPIELVNEVAGNRAARRGKSRKMVMIDSVAARRKPAIKKKDKRK